MSERGYKNRACARYETDEERKAAQAENYKRWYEENKDSVKEKRNAQSKEYHSKNKERINKRQKKYYGENREQIIETQKIRYKKNKSTKGAAPILKIEIRLENLERDFKKLKEHIDSIIFGSRINEN